MISFVYLLASFVLPVLGAEPPTPPCPDDLPSCAAGSEEGSNILADSIAPLIATGNIQIAVACALLFVLYAGLQLAISNGDEGKIDKARKAILYSIGGLIIALLSQSIYKIFADHDFSGNVENAIFDIIIQTMATVIVKVFNPIFIIVIVIAGIRMLLDRGKDEEFRKAKTMILWACMGAIVINVAYAIVKAVINIFTSAAA